MSIKKISEIISNKLKCKIQIKKNLSDPRSYRLDSSKLLKTGFKPKKKISNAIEEIIQMYKKGILKDKPKHHSILWLKKILK